MSYLLCYAGFRKGTIDDLEKMRTQFMAIPPLPYVGSPSNSTPVLPDVNIEEFETFKDAVSQYTYRCLFCSQVTLSLINDLTGEGEIIRQYSYSRSDSPSFIR